MTNPLPAGLDAEAVAALVDRALAEDLGAGLPGAGPNGSASLGVDVTSAATIPDDLIGAADVRTRAAGVVAGIPVAAQVFRRAGAEVTEVASDGDRVSPGDVVLTATGPVQRLLTVERTMLNLLCHLSGIATLTAAWVDAVTGTGARIRDTRKTTPGLRALEKYAVRCGGGVNHRMGLWDAALVKDNHVAAAGGWPPPSAPSGGASRASRSRSSATPSPRCRRRSTPAPTSSCWTTCRCLTWRRASSWPRTRCCWKRPAG